MNTTNALNPDILDKNKSNWILPAIITLILAAIPFAVGKYYEFNTDDPFDGALNIYNAHELVLGKKIGVDIFPAARPATLLVNFIGVKLFGYSEFGPILIQTLMQITALGFAFACIKKLFGNIPAIISVILGTFYLSCQPYAKFGNVKEQYMIACMIIAACSFIYYEIQNKKYWLLLCGAFAINIWYFKPTGFSLPTALLFYLIITTILRQRKISSFANELSFISIGAVIGIIPLALFFAKYGDAKKILTVFPVSPAIIIAGIYYLTIIVKLVIAIISKNRNKVDSKIIKRGSISILVTLAIVIAIFSMLGQSKEIIRDLFGDPIDLVKSTFDFSTGAFERLYSTIFSDSGYVSGSHIVSTFSKQFAEVSKYSHSFAIPIGLGIAAVIWYIKSLFTSKTSDNESETDSYTNRVVIFLSIWWILDMLFIWISPRAYVQYFLPPNGSIMFLAAYILNRSSKNVYGYLFIGISWLLVEIFTACQSAASISIASLIGAIAFMALPVYTITAKNNLLLSKLVFTIVLAIAIIIGNADNYSSLKEKIETTNNFIKAGGAPWQQLGQSLKKESSEDDAIFVWGWYPGIYVAAERSCPSSRPSYSDMHSDIPKAVGNRINKYVLELKQNPPLFIVDSQKMHYPYYEHPVYDLWTTVPLDIGRNPKRKILVKTAEIKAFEAQYYEQVKKYCIALTTQKNRAGGPLSQEKAEELAELEVERHKKMEPLREFVMQNYIPFKRYGTMVVYKRK